MLASLWGGKLGIYSPSSMAGLPRADEVLWYQFRDTVSNLSQMDNPGPTSPKGTRLVKLNPLPQLVSSEPDRTWSAWQVKLHTLFHG